MATLTMATNSVVLIGDYNKMNQFGLAYGLKTVGERTSINELRK